MLNKQKCIIVTEQDIGQVRQLVINAINTSGGMTLEYARMLSEEINNAKVLPEEQAKDVVGLNSQVWITNHDSQAKESYTIVPPEESDSASGRISILSPMGMALFGYKKGDQIDWGPVQMSIRAVINKVSHQPSARRASTSVDKEDRALTNTND